MKDIKLRNANDLDLIAEPLDMNYDSNGSMEMVDGLQQADQAIMKALFTVFGTNSLRPLYGGSFGNIIGVKMDRISGNILISAEVDRIVNRIGKLTRDNLLTNAAQRIVALEDIVVDRVDGTPRRLSVDLLVRTESGENSELQATFQSY